MDAPIQLQKCARLHNRRQQQQQKNSSTPVYTRIKNKHKPLQTSTNLFKQQFTSQIVLQMLQDTCTSKNAKETKCKYKSRFSASQLQTFRHWQGTLSRHIQVMQLNLKLLNGRALSWIMSTFALKQHNTKQHFCHKHAE